MTEIEELELIKEHYPDTGTKKLIGLINKSAEYIRNAAYKNKIKFNATLQVDEKYLKEFYFITKPEIAYYLGYWWADAYISDDTNTFSFGIQEIDGIAAKESLFSILPFNLNIRRLKSRPHVQRTMVFNKSDPNLHKFLTDNDYHIKSNYAPIKILKKIPKDLHYAFWQGFFMGDGCIYLCKIRGKIHPRVSFAGQHGQDWGFYKDLCNELGVRFKILQSENHVGRWSNVYIQTINECFKFLDYIYSKGVIGPRRKYEKYLELKATTELTQPKSSKFKGVCHRKGRDLEWESFTAFNRKFKCIGYFKTELEAAQARDKFLIDNNLHLNPKYKLNF